jgi:hypothetical protein
VPVGDKLFVNVGHEILNETHYIIFNVEGKQVLSGRIFNSKSQLNLNELAAGVYVLQIQDSGSLMKREFIKL